MRWTVVLGLLLLLIAPVAATSLNFQNPSDATQVTLINYTPTDYTILNSITWSRSSTGGNNYMNVFRAATPSDQGYKFAGFRLKNPYQTTYSSATLISFTGVQSCPKPALFDVNKNIIWIPNNIYTATATANIGKRWEVKILGGTAYLYANGVLLSNSTPLSINPSFIAWGTNGLVPDGGTSGAINAQWDDLVYGDTEQTHILGIPESDNETYVILKDIINPAASGLAFGENATVVSSTSMSTQWGRGNHTVGADAVQPDETIQLVNMQTGTSYSSITTGTSSYAGTSTFNIKTAIIDSGAPMGFYALHYPNHLTVYSNPILYKSTGASVRFDQPEYSPSDPATIIYYVFSGGYWDTSTYRYRLDIVNVYGDVKSTTPLTASTGTITHEWSETDDLGVYYALLYATTLADNKDYIIGSDATELVGTFRISGYVMDGTNLTKLSNAKVNLTQGTLNANTTSDANGFYNATDFETGLTLFIEVSKPGYDSYLFNFTPLASRTQNLNFTLLPPVGSRTVVGAGIDGVIRDRLYGQPLSNSYGNVRNLTTGQFYVAPTNLAGYYICDWAHICYLAENTVYEDWGSKDNYPNSSTYYVRTTYSGL